MLTEQCASLAFCRLHAKVSNEFSNDLTEVSFMILQPKLYSVEVNWHGVSLSDSCKSDYVFSLF